MVKGTRIAKLARLVVALGAVVFVAGVLASGDAAANEMTVTKFCSPPAAPGGPIHFWGEICNPGGGFYPRATVYDDKTQSLLVDVYEDLAGGTCIPFQGDYYPTTLDGCDTNTVTATGYLYDGSILIQVTASATCCAPQIEAICRTPGFWGTHAGTEKPNSQNITQAVINAAGGSLSVCGETINNTNLNVLDSGLEAMCVSIKGAIQLQLARQLTAASLNCVMTDGNADCTGMALQGLFSSCNAACVANTDPTLMDDCRKKLDCWNNGGIPLDSGMCQLGTCEGGAAPCEKNEDCGLNPETGAQIMCVPTPGNCHDRPLVNEDLGLNFDPPGAAGSSDACNSAIKNSCNIFSTSCGVKK